MLTSIGIITFYWFLVGTAASIGAYIGITICSGLHHLGLTMWGN